MAKTNYRAGRDRRRGSRGQRGGVIAGINVLAFEFRDSEGSLTVSIHRVAADGTVQGVDLGYTAGTAMPFGDCAILNASNPGSPVTITSCEYQGGNTFLFEFDGLPLVDVGTLLIPPWLDGWTDRQGRPIGGLYVTIP